MSDTVLAALIGAGSSIIVAFVGKKTADDSRLESRRVPGRKLPTPAWVVTLALLALWLLISPAAIHHDFVGTNIFLIPIVLIVLAIAQPIRPLTAGWVALAIFSSNFVLGPLGNRMVHSRYDRELGIPQESAWSILLIGFIAAALVAGVAAWRLRQRAPVVSVPMSPTPPARERAPAADAGVTNSLERLAVLHTEGKLSDEEFRNAKKKILSDAS